MKISTASFRLTSGKSPFCKLGLRNIFRAETEKDENQRQRECNAPNQNLNNTDFNATPGGYQRGIIRAVNCNDLTIAHLTSPYIGTCARFLVVPALLFRFIPSAIGQTGFCIASVNRIADRLASFCRETPFLGDCGRGRPKGALECGGLPPPLNV
jgi:hypothetical protein